jgi:predicted metal-dependent HD superfamily phosphohydrolase
VPRIEQWQGLWKELGVAPSVADTLYDELIARYSEPHRHYHTLQHLDECFGWLAETRALAEHPGEIELALWFHDAIHDVKRDDNEMKSAEWATSAVLAAGLRSDVADRIHDLIMATCHNAAPHTRDAQLLVDIDLSILGALPVRFDEYERQVRAEYEWVPALIFKRERRRILAAFLARPRIFTTDTFFDRLESAARSNLQRSIASL